MSENSIFLLFLQCFLHIQKQISSFEPPLISVCHLVNSLPSDKVLNWSKLKALADDKINLTEKLKFGLGRVQKIVGKEENAGYKHSLISPTMFSKGFLCRVVKSRDSDV